MKIPTYLQNHVQDYHEHEFATMTVCAADKNEQLEIWYYGALYLVKSEGRTYIVDTETAPCLVLAKDCASGEEILLFDGAKHGYDNMFCDCYEAAALVGRPLKRLDIPAGKIIVELGYGIDYEEEREDYEFDEDGNVVLIDGSRMAWEDVIVNGFDYIGLSLEDKHGERIPFLNVELA